ncbi:acyltransferase family protein [Pseudonocardia endophytica]|uniref:Peptidoglycan/LPS O-acetylase OafA/YrhL n=1 Tax=Pseudonocardia endophytica TaxID=401976 RepID=A0A4R1HFB4_PSEEN|nr:acyltransferase [Pseudonocardia endophytica]TCK20827.1 peptidoglycan/LPS O-acetylase OafA/YrhL [Pseudonocardia endophytica]
MRPADPAKAAERTVDVPLDVLRTLAAVLVVVSHVRALFFRDWDDVTHGMANAGFYALTHLGHAAVIVFFVLSGYWVGGTVVRQIGDGRFRWRSYLLRRLTRLWIVLVPALVLAWGAATLGLARFGTTEVYLGTPAYDGVTVPGMADHIGPGTGLGNVFFLQGIVVPEFGGDIPLWSLTYEFAYYLLLPLALCAVVAGRRPAVRVVCAVLAAAIAVGVGLPVLALFPAWLLGAAIAWQEPRLLAPFAGRRGRTVALRAAGPLATAAFLAVQVTLPRGGVAADLALGLATGVLLLGLRTVTVGDGAVGRVTRSVGAYANASYSLYLVHLPLLVLFSATLFRTADTRWAPSAWSIAAFAGISVAMLVVGHGFASLTEFHTDRLRRWVDAHLAVPAWAVRSRARGLLQPGQQTS